jgi:hypothetical protein
MRFDRAEFADQEGPACTLCSTPLTDRYHEIDGAMACDGCRDEALRDVAGRGSAPSRVLRAAAAGLAGAVVGAGIYYAVLAISGYEVGLIAILVGLLVGGGVRWGSHGRGGWLYQGLAVVLTYTAIVSTYVPFILGAWKKQEAIETVSAMSDEELAVMAGNAPAGATATGAAATASTAEMKPDAKDSPRVATNLSGAATAPSCGQAIVAVALFGAFVAAVPFLAGFENIIGWLIIGFALYQAWKMNKRTQRVIAGPYHLAMRGAAMPAPAEE